MRTGLTKQEKTTEIYFDEKEPTIYIRTHNTDLKNKLTAYAAAHPASAARPTQTRKRATWSLKSARGVSPFG